MGARFTVTGTWTVEVTDEMAVKEAGFMARRRHPRQQHLPIEDETVQIALASVFHLSPEGTVGLRVVGASVTVEDAAITS